MPYLLDTNVCIRYLNGRSALLADRMRSIQNSDIFVCSIVKAELYYGAMRSIDLARTLGLQNVFLNQFISLPFDDSCALLAGKWRHRLNLMGTPIGPYDLQIAAIALANNVTLVTHNTREFSRMSDLILEDWEI